MDWVPIDFGEIFDKRRPFPNKKGMAKVKDRNGEPERGGVNGSR
jgi:hypothetical protein